MIEIMNPWKRDLTPSFLWSHKKMESLTSIPLCEIKIIMEFILSGRTRYCLLFGWFLRRNAVIGIEGINFIFSSWHKPCRERNICREPLTHQMYLSFYFIFHDVSPYFLSKDLMGIRRFSYLFGPPLKPVSTYYLYLQFIVYTVTSDFQASPVTAMVEYILKRMYYSCCYAFFSDFLFEIGLLRKRSGAVSHIFDLFLRFRRWFLREKKVCSEKILWLGDKTFSTDKRNSLNKYITYFWEWTIWILWWNWMVWFY